LTQKYLYFAYDLRVESDFPLPELQEVKDEGSPDVIIKTGITPTTLEGVVEKGILFEASKDKFLLRLDKIARFHVINGNEITVEPFKDSDEEDIRVFLLGSVFAALLHQRGYLVLHGSCIEINGDGILFTGVSGVGKSTLAAAFHKKGYKILTDDVCAIKISQTGIPMVIPGFPRLKLWEDAAERLGEDISSLSPIRRKLQKYRVNVEEKFSKDPVPLSSIYLLKPGNNEKISVTEIKDFDKIDTLIKNTYRFRFMKAQGGKALHLKQCAAVARNTGIYSVIRPNKEFMLDELALTIEKEIDSLW